MPAVSMPIATSATVVVCTSRQATGLSSTTKYGENVTADKSARAPTWNRGSSPQIPDTTSRVRNGCPAFTSAGQSIHSTVTGTTLVAGSWQASSTHSNTTTAGRIDLSSEGTLSSLPAVDRRMDGLA